MVQQAAVLFAIGIAMGLGLGAVRGIPKVAEPENAAVCAAEQDGEPVAWIDQDDAHALHQKALRHQTQVAFVDARSLAAFRAGHVAGALSLPLENGVLPRNLPPALAEAQTVVTYCDTSSQCAASVRLAGLLRTTGVQDVRVLRGGMPAWVNQGYPAEAGQ